MVDEYGNKNIVVCRMEDVFQSKTRLTMEKLKSWSRSIAVDFSAKNTPPKLLNLTSYSADFIKTINCNTTLLLQMTTSNNSNEVEIDRKDKKIMELESKIEQLQKRNKHLELVA